TRSTHRPARTRLSRPHHHRRARSARLHDPPLPPACSPESRPPGAAVLPFQGCDSRRRFCARPASRSAPLRCPSDPALLFRAPPSPPLSDPDLTQDEVCRAHRPPYNSGSQRSGGGARSRFGGTKSVGASPSTRIMLSGPNNRTGGCAASPPRQGGAREGALDHTTSVWLGIDVGTGSARAGLFTSEGQLLAIARHEIL